PPTCRNNCCSFDDRPAVALRWCCDSYCMLRQHWTGTSSGGAGADCNVPTGSVAQPRPTHDRQSHSSESGGFCPQLPGAGGAVEVVLLPWYGGATGAPPKASCRPWRFPMTAKKKRISPDPALKKKTRAKGPTPSTPERVSPPAADKA